MEVDEQPTDQESIAFAAAWMMALGLTIGMAVPVIGPLIAGAVGGRRARTPGRALAAFIVPALFVGGTVAAFAHRGIPVKGGNTVWLPPGLTAAIQVTALLAGAMTGAVGRASKFVGLVVLVASLALFQRFYSVYLAPAIRIGLEAQHASSVSATAGTEVSADPCTTNLQQLYTATEQYADDWDGKLPPADRWMSALGDPPEGKVQAPTLHDPAVATVGTGYGYAMNAALGGKRLKDVRNQAVTPLYYDSSDLSLNAHDAVSSLPVPGRHGGRDNVLYADGHIAQR